MSETDDIRDAWAQIKQKLDLIRVRANFLLYLDEFKEPPARYDIEYIIKFVKEVEELIEVYEGFIPEGEDD